MGIISPYSDSITTSPRNFLLPFFLWDWLLPSPKVKPQLRPILLLKIIMVITVTLDTTVDTVDTVDTVADTMEDMVDTTTVDTDTMVARNVMPRLIPLSLLQPLLSQHLKFTLIHTLTDFLMLTMLLQLPSLIHIPSHIPIPKLMLILKLGMDTITVMVDMVDIADTTDIDMVDTTDIPIGAYGAMDMANR